MYNLVKINQYTCTNFLWNLFNWLGYKYLNVTYNNILVVWWQSVLWYLLCAKSQKIRNMQKARKYLICRKPKNTLFKDAYELLRFPSKRTTCIWPCEMKMIILLLDVSHNTNIVIIKNIIECPTIINKLLSEIPY
jgi:hypothetical protein